MQSLGLNEGLRFRVEGLAQPTDHKSGMLYGVSGVQLHRN